MSMTLVIFDCDGVLVESEAICIAAEIDFLSQHGLEFERDAYMRAFMGMAPREWEQKLRVALSAHLGIENDRVYHSKPLS
jgi:beta-phosphoglucomutase-like phosphatase (HAD superfamily)